MILINCNVLQNFYMVISRNRPNEKRKTKNERNPYPLAISLGLHGMAEKHGFSYDFRDNLSKMSTITVLDQCFSLQNVQYSSMQCTVCSVDDI